MQNTTNHDIVNINIVATGKAEISQNAKKAISKTRTHNSWTIRNSA